ncbi:hypothetical protein RPPS3_25480 [Rhodopseudomonas palustris]|uniref:hypothetical protein n=1 Tax=Rhodopseudomonas palustris TaxID=1076 RepID=UPI000D1B796F|nr:hypothetical protein [Rhodopseudomonas palustris]AVT76611.1 hypothetical protein RPPS3_25480 [Rhodopseudomonas palustris]
MGETSYPFFRIARAFGVPYGLVLAYRDAVIKAAAIRFVSLDYWERRAWSALSGTSAGLAIVYAIERESWRRAGVLYQPAGDRA